MQTQPQPANSELETTEPPRRVTLYDIVDDLSYQLSSIEAIEADETLSEDEKAERVKVLLDAFLASRESLADKIQSCFMVHRNYLGEIAVIKAEEERLEARRKIREAADARLESYVREQLGRIEGRKIKTPFMTCALTKVKDGKVIVDDEAKIPKTLECWKPQAPKLDKDAIKRAIKGGVDVPGARLVASERFVWR